MKHFDLSIYKETRIYLKFFDSHIKINNHVKEEIFEKLYINNSSYRRARDYEQNVGRQIVKTLSDFYGLSIPCENDIDDLEKLFNKIYHNMYYKIYDSFYEDMNYVIKIKQKNSLLFPIINILQLLLIINSEKNISDVYGNYMELYQNTKIYVSFLNNDLFEILEMIGLFFDDVNFEDGEWIKEYNNALTYQIIASKCHIKKRYIESIFYANKSRELLLKDLNFKRIIYVNLIIMSCLLYVGNYNECFNLSNNQLAYLNSVKLTDFEKKSTFKFYIVSLFGMRDYVLITKLLKEYDSLNLTLLTCLLVSYYFVNRDEYIHTYNHLMNNENISDSDKSFCISLNSYLKFKNKKVLKTIEKYDLMGAIIKILKKI